jgi:hypothetical protein
MDETSKAATLLGRRGGNTVSAKRVLKARNNLKHARSFWKHASPEEITAAREKQYYKRWGKQRKTLANIGSNNGAKTLHKTVDTQSGSG